MELKELTIKELLSDYILIIPEIQREYVWGSNKEVLSKFLSELNSTLGEIPQEKLQAVKPCFDDRDTASDIREKLNSSLKKVNNYYETNIGFLYSYDAGNNEHFIIDGQQRLTTIVLLAYYYAVKDDRVSDFKTLLKTETPLIHFSYRVRPLTEQFLQNLFTGVSLDILKNLKEAKWYVSDYNNDKTIESICNLYKFICDDENSFSNLNYVSLLWRVKFYYFDVQQTSQGEELYITMNSRGEQLKDFEQIKPYILGNIEDSGERLKAAQKWDGWEEYFFEKLKKSEKEINEVEVSKIDIAMDNIIKITLELYGEKRGVETDENRKREFEEIKAAEDSKRIEFSKIAKVVENITSLLDSGKDEIQKREFIKFLFTKEREKKSLYLIESLIRAKELIFDDENIHRLIRLVNNSLSYGIINHVALLKFLSKMEKTADIYQYINSHQDIVNDVFISQNNNEELYKIQAILENKVSEAEIEAAEALPVFSGKIHLLYRDLSREISWEKFDDKLREAKNWFSIDDKTAIQEEKYTDFIIKFVKEFDNWGQLYGFFIINNEVKYWQKLLTEKNCLYLIPLDSILLNETYDSIKTFDNNTSPIYNFFSNKKTLKQIIQMNLNGRLNWYSSVLAFYPYGGGEAIVFDWGDFQRQECMNELMKSEMISLKNQNDVVGDYIKGWDIQFSFNNKEYTWTWKNEIKCENKAIPGSKMQGVTVGQMKDLLCNL